MYVGCLAAHVGRTGFSNCNRLFMPLEQSRVLPNILSELSPIRRRHSTSNDVYAHRQQIRDRGTTCPCVVTTKELQYNLM